MNKSIFYMIVIYMTAILLWSSTSKAQSFFKGTHLIETPSTSATTGGTTNLNVNDQTLRRFTGTLNQEVVLPDATGLSLGIYYLIANDTTTGTLTVKDNGGTTLAIILPTNSASFRLIAKGSAAGTWSIENNYTATPASTVSGILPLANGGTNANLSASTGSFVYSTASAMSWTAANTMSWDATNAALNISAPVYMRAAGYSNVELNDVLLEASSTGVIDGGVLSINVDNTKFDLSAGEGHIVDPTVTPETFKEINWSTFTAQSISGGIASRDFTYVYIDANGNISQEANAPTPSEYRNKIYIGRVAHINRSTINSARSVPVIAQQVASQVYDLTAALGSFNISGNEFSANGANLQINKSAGTLYQQSYQWATQEKNPSTVSIAATTGGSFFYATSTTVSGASTTSVEPQFYDVAGTKTSVGGPAATSTNQRIYLFGSGVVYIQYGQQTYSTLADAIANIPYESFTTNPVITQGRALLVGFLSVQRSATALNSTTQARFTPAGKFGNVSAAGGGTTTLQQAYDNSAVTPQITVTSTLGAVNIADASSTIGSIFRVTNNGASTRYFDVSAVGISTSGNIQASGLTTAGPVITSAAGLLSSEAQLALSRGGTNANITASLGGVAYSTASAISLTAVGISGQRLVSQGAAAPIWQSEHNTQGTRQTGTSISASTQITPVVGARNTIFVAGNGGNVTVTQATPFVTTNMVVGQLMFVCGTSDTNTVTYNNGNNLVLKGSAILGKDDCIDLTYLGSDGTNAAWVEVGRNF